MAPEQTRPPAGDISSTFETFSPSTGTGGDPICRGTHQYEDATVERTYHRSDEGVLAAETAFLEGEDTIDVLDECWLLTDGTALRHTGTPVLEFCRDHHYSEPAADIAFCLSDPAETDRHAIEIGDVTSTFQPTSEVKIDRGAVLRFTGSHEETDARIQRAFFVDETGKKLRIRTVYFWKDERLGSVTEHQPLIDGGEFVEATGEPVDAYCRRTHLQEPEMDLEYCVQLGRGDPPTVPPDGE